MLHLKLLEFIKVSLYLKICGFLLFIFTLFPCRPPRLMGEGFVVMQSNDVDIYYYMDEPGTVC